MKSTGKRGLVEVDDYRIKYTCQNPSCGHVTYAPPEAKAIICGACRGFESPPARAASETAASISKPDMLALIISTLAIIAAVLS